MAEAKTEQTEKRKAKVTTGLGALDTMLGGLPNGIIILLVGEPGSGSDIFGLLRYLINRSEQLNHFVLCLNLQ